MRIESHLPIVPTAQFVVIPTERETQLIRGLEFKFSLSKEVIAGARVLAKICSSQKPWTSSIVLWVVSEIEIEGTPIVPEDEIVAVFLAWIRAGKSVERLTNGRAFGGIAGKA